MYLSTEWLIPCSVRKSAFFNDSGSCGPVDAAIAGISYTPGKKLELIIAQGSSRFYDVRLSDTGLQGGEQFSLLDTLEIPWITHEPRPRRVTAIRLSQAPQARGLCYGALTWEKANVTLLLVVLDSGEVIFWPPHKIIWSELVQPQPAWLKRRYEDDRDPLEYTKVSEAQDEEVSLRLDLAKKAMSDISGWRAHGIGLIQKYMYMPKGDLGDKQYRVHIWTPDSVKIGLESGIHDHRYDLESYILCGTLTQEEWKLEPNPAGMWRAWIHHNDTREPEKTDRFFDATPRTQDIRTGQKYTFPRVGFHRSLPRSEIVISVMERFHVMGNSHTICPRGHTPLNGQSVDLDIAGILAKAKKHIGMR